MAVTPNTVWIANDILTAAALNAEFNNVYNQGQAIGFPRTANADFNGYTLILDADADTSLRADTDDEIDIAIGGTDTYLLTATEMTILGRRVLTTVDRAQLLREIRGETIRVRMTEARVADLESSNGLLMAQLNNF